jgi:hypothetical protein
MAHWPARIAVPDGSDASSTAVGGLIAQLVLAGRGHRESRHPANAYDRAKARALIELAR